MQGKCYRRGADHYSSQQKCSNVSRQTADTDTGQLLLLSFQLNRSNAQRLILWKQRFLEIKWQDAIFHPADLLHERWRQTTQLMGSVWKCAFGISLWFTGGVIYAFITIRHTAVIFNLGHCCSSVKGVIVFSWDV